MTTLETFRAIVADRGAHGLTVAVKDVTLDDLMAGDIAMALESSTVNYKDGLGITGRAPIIAAFPLIPGIDLAGTVEGSGRSPSPFFPSSAIGSSLRHVFGQCEVPVENRLDASIE